MTRLNVLRTGRMLGYPVRNPEGESIGRVEEVVVDSTGRIAYVILSFDEPLGTEERLFALPWRALDVASNGKSFILNVSRERLRNAPSFHREEWPDLTDPTWGSHVYRYYDHEPFWTVRRADTATELSSGETRRSYRAARGRSGAGWLAVALLLVVVAGIAFYMMYPRETEIAAESVGRSAERAAVAVREASEGAATTAKVKTALALSKQVSAFEIDVDTEDGVVTLEGEVPSETAKQVAAAIAQDTSGVDTVTNRLIVSSGAQAVPEAERVAPRVADIEHRVMVGEALLADPDLARQSLRVVVEDGVVILSGRVENPTQRSRAEEIARGVAGVREVVNQIEVMGRLE